MCGFYNAAESITIFFDSIRSAQELQQCVIPEPELRVYCFFPWFATDSILALRASWSPR